MSPSPKKVRHARIERPQAKAENFDDTSMLWAVSYADFLMVLLSFFIIFFSFEHSKNKDILNRIIQSTKTIETGKRAPTAIGEGSSSGTGDGGVVPGTLTQEQSEALVSQMGTLFKAFKTDQRKEPVQLVIYMPDDSFRKGEVELSPEHRPEFKEAIENLKKFEKDISLTFVGHADKSPVMHLENRKFVDNFDLSALRATWALREAARLGLDPKNLQAKGVAENSRGSRTVSIVIEAKRPL